MIRLLALVLGPPLIVSLAYLLTQANGRVGTLDDSNWAMKSISERPERNHAASDVAILANACKQKREAIIRKLGGSFSVVIHEPFVLASDLSANEIDRHYRETIAPTARALAITYFDKPPIEPITILLLSDDRSYQDCADRLDGQKRAAFAGYYERGDRRIVLNTRTGDGTIAHELTHALAHFDFPDMPEWFDEGLASLHEEAQLSNDGLKISGTSNWRARFLVPAIRNRSLRPIESLIGATHVRGDQQAIDYAHARYFCLFLQERGLLEPFYRKFRLAVHEDPTGLLTLRAIFGVSNLTGIDEEFRAWAMALEKPRVRSQLRGSTEDNSSAHGSKIGGQTRTAKP